MLHGMQAMENRRLFSLQLNTEDSPESGKAEVFGCAGSFINGISDWSMEGRNLNIGKRTFNIDDCTKDFLKITDTKDRTAYLFITQQSKSIKLS
jgi:hypothetical protein